MAREILAIGNTGSQLVSKFNDNFLELYQFVIDADLHGAVGDGNTDNFSVLQGLITNFPGVKIKIGYDLTDVYIISQPLNCVADTILEINGTLKMKDGAIRSISGNVAIGATSIPVANANTYYASGQWIAITDEDQPLVGGGSGGRVNREGEGRLITSVTGTAVNFTTPLISGYTTAKNGRIGHIQSCILVNNVDNVVITGKGVIDNNQANQDDSEPLRGVGAFEPLMGTCITAEDSDNLAIHGIRLINGAQHNLVTDSVNNIYLNNLRLEDAYDKNILMIATYYGNISNIHIDDAVNEDGIILYSGNKYLNFNNIYIANCPRGAFTINQSNEHITVNGLLMKDNNLGLSVNQNTKWVTCNNVQAAGAYASLLSINKAENVTINNFICDNENGGSNGLAVVMGGAKNITINNMQLLNTDGVAGGDTGIGLTLAALSGASPDGVYVYNSLFRDLKKGVDVAATCAEVYFFNCIFRGNVANGNDANATYTNCIGLS